MESQSNGNSNSSYDQTQFKVILIGDAGVGKTNLLSRFCNNEFNPDSRPSLGIESGTVAMSIDGKQIRAQIWDTSGQERFRAITGNYYRNVSGALVVFDICRRSSFQSARNWLGELMQRAPPYIVVVLVGNKLDLQRQRDVSKQEAENFARKQGFLYIETSALNSTNVDSAFNLVLTQIYRVQSKMALKVAAGDGTVELSAQQLPRRFGGIGTGMDDDDEYDESCRGRRNYGCCGG